MLNFDHMGLLEEVEQAAEELRRAQDRAHADVQTARQALGEAIRAAQAEKIPLAALARVAGYSREYMRILRNEKPGPTKEAG